MPERRSALSAKQFRKWLVATALLAPVFSLAIALVCAAVAGVSGDTTADNELGQLDFVHATAGFVRPQALNLGGDNVSANGVAIDEASGHLYVADSFNSRVLGWSSAAAFHNGDPANIVIGQTDFYTSGCHGGGLCTPRGVAVDRSDNLYVTEGATGVVIEYAKPFSQTPPITGIVVANGGFDFWGVAVDGGGNLYVADRNDSRVLEYNSPLNHAATPNRVFGQTSVTTFAGCNQGKASPTASTLCTPRAVAIDSLNNLYVADTANSRVLRYNTPLNPSSGEAGAGDTVADMVFGQSGFTTATGGTTATTLNQPRGLTVDLNGNLYITDTENDRVTEYDPPLHNGEAASLVIGQIDATAADGCNQGHIPDQYTVCTPAGACADSAGNLYVHDSANNRILEYNESHTPTNVIANRELGQHDLTHNTVNFVDLTTVNPIALAIDRHSMHQHLYVVDAANNRVLGYDSASTFVNGGAANLVLGQFDFWNNYKICTFPSPTTLCLNSNFGGIAVDSLGNVWVADSGYRRVIGYKSPFATGLTANQAASFVLGEPNLETAGGGIGCLANNTNTCAAAGLAVDTSDNLYVVDTENQRVLEFAQPRSFTGTLPQPANLVFGQGSTGKNFTAGGCNQGGVSANSLCGPLGVVLDAHNNLYIGDSANNRVLEYDRPIPFGGGTPGTPGAAGDVTADLVFGQGSAGKSFTANACNNGGLGALTLCSPVGVAVDTFNSLFVSDTANNRILAFKESANPPVNVTPGIEFGQGSSGTDFTHNSVNAGGLSASSLSLSASASGLAADINGDLYATDAGNHRVLRYNGGFLGAPTPTPRPTPTRTPTPTHTPTARPT